MPRLLLEVPHALDRDEALRRLKGRFAAARAEYRDRVSKFHDEWKDHTFSFSLQALGMGVSGTLSVEPRKIRLEVALPLAAVLFKRAIEDRLRQEVNSLLGSDGTANPGNERG